MKLSEAIELLQDTLDRHGDGELLPHDLGEGLKVEESQFSHKIILRHATKKQIKYYEWILTEE